MSPPSCDKSQFACKKGKPQCIPLQWRCDGNSECSDHSDEIGCPKCGVGNFRCTNENCINATLICDGTNDCKDSSDEVKCCPGPNMFQCKSTKKCIDEADICNDIKDCDDGSDEYFPQCTKIQQPLKNIPEVEEDFTHLTITILSIVFTVIVGVVIVIIYK